MVYAKCKRECGGQDSITLQMGTGCVDVLVPGATATATATDTSASASSIGLRQPGLAATGVALHCHFVAYVYACVTIIIILESRVLYLCVLDYRWK